MNTRSKRASSMGLSLIWLLSPVAPDGTIALQDRQHIALSYSGIVMRSAALSGTALAGITEADLVGGGANKTIIITLNGDTFIPA
jgi:hypothetical protein